MGSSCRRKRGSGVEILPASGKVIKDQKSRSSQEARQNKGYPDPAGVVGFPQKPGYLGRGLVQHLGQGGKGLGAFRQCRHLQHLGQVTQGQSGFFTGVFIDLPAHQGTVAPADGQGDVGIPHVQGLLVWRGNHRQVFGHLGGTQHLTDGKAGDARQAKINGPAGAGQINPQTDNQTAEKYRREPPHPLVDVPGQRRHQENYQ